VIVLQFEQFSCYSKIIGYSSSASLVNTLSEKNWQVEIAKILKSRNLTQNGFAAALDIDGSLVSHWMQGKRQPGELLCLAIATLAAKEDIEYWIDLSGLTRKQLLMVGAALKVPEPTLLSTEERNLVNWWRNPKNQMEQGIKTVVETLLNARTD